MQIPIAFSAVKHVGINSGDRDLAVAPARLDVFCVEIDCFVGAAFPQSAVRDPGDGLSALPCARTGFDTGHSAVLHERELGALIDKILC